jgi:hypothetical protein
MQSDSAVQRDWTTTLIVVYGAVLATIVFLWDLYKRWADRGVKIAVNFRAGEFARFEAQRIADEGQSCLLEMAP